MTRIQSTMQEARGSSQSIALEPCMFPASDVGECHGEQFLSNEDSLRSIADLDATQVRSALCVAWGILLECFTGLENVCFGLETDQSTTTKINGHPMTDTQIACIHISNEKTVLALLDEISSGLLPAANHNADELYNTTLCIRNLPTNFQRDETHHQITDSGSTGSENTQCKARMTVDPSSFRTILSWTSSFMTAEQAQNVSSTFGKIFNEITTKSQTRVSQLDWFSDRNLRQVLAWNGNTKSHVMRCIHEVISEGASSRPEAEAVCAWDGSFTYTDLLHLSDLLARRLAASGVGPEVFVPICFDKSRWTIVAMLAVLKAGGIFVPLDPSHPIPRLLALVQKVGATTLLCSRQHLGMLEGVAPELIPVDDTLFKELPQTSEHVKPASWDNGAYMIFTSGTTGEPKGALIQHGALLSSAFAHGPAMMMDQNTRSLQFAAYTFDVSITEILTCLILGGCVCVPSEEARLNSIEEAIVELGANWALLTPTFVKFINPAKVPCLKTLVTGGEAMTQAIIRSWSHINLTNCYGPAETSVVSHVHRGMKDGKNPLNIGRQVGIHCWIVDRYNHHRLMPVGAVGELVIEGHTLAREYYKEYERTADAFIINPQWVHSQQFAEPQRRMYKTGDLVKYNHDGTFHICGRKDTQIKFHGQRIELGEIEHHLNINPDIKHGMIVLPKTGPCQGRLLAVIQLSDVLGQDLVPNGERYKLIDGELRQVAKHKIEEAKFLLSERLPPYMIPSMWIAVEFIPRLQSGKLDRKQTAQWIDGMTEDLFRRLNPTPINGSSEDMTLASKDEKAIHQVWTHVLNLKPDQLGLHQSFLSVGGDSISAMQVMSECKKFGLGLAVRNIISCKSISDLASHVKAVEMPVFHKEVLEQPFDLSPIQKLYFSRSNHDRGHYNQSFLLRTSRRIFAADLRIALEAIIARHSMLRARFTKTSHGEWQQRITNEVASSYRLRTLSVDSQEHIDTILAASQTCLSDTQGPLFAADIIDVAGDESFLFVVAHHLIIDLVSWRIILQELEEFLLRPDTTSQKEQPLPFQTWCQLQSEHAKSLGSAQVLPAETVPDGNPEYWGMESQPNVYGQMIHEGFEIGPELTSQLLSDCHQAMRTEIPDILLAALIHSFGQTFTDRSMPAIFAEGHGRESWDPSIDLSNVVGWFTTIYPVYAGPSAHVNLVDVVKLVKDYRRNILDQGRPYFASRWLTEEGEQAFQRHWPLEITFNYLGQYQQLEREGALFTPARGIAGETRGAADGADVGSETTCISLFEISAVILKGCLRFSFAFNKNMKHQAEIRRWISTCQESLGLSIERLSMMAPQPTLSDFPLLSLTYDRLNLMMTDRLRQVGILSLDQVEDVFPCSPIQSGLLVSTAKNAAFYAAYTLHEVKSRSGLAVDPRQLADAWRRLVQYHPMLRTIFIESVTEEVSLYDQVVLHNVDPVLHQHLERDTDEEALSTLSAPPSHPTDNTQPLHSFQICTSKTGKVFCRLDISHIIMDGTSMSILFRDLSLAYQGNLGQGPLYRDYIKYLQAQPTQSSSDYWASYLAGAEPCHFPVLNDGNVPKFKELRYVRVKFDKLQELQRLCEERRVTIVNAIYTAWALTLSLYTGTEDVCFGHLTSARDAPIEGIRDVVGPVINLLACRVDVSRSTSLGDMMSAVQRDFLDSLPHRHIPLADVQHALNLSNTALFNTALSYRKLPPPVENPPDIEFEECRPTYDPDEYNVSINIEAGEADMAIDLMYWTDTLCDGQAENIVDAFTNALNNILHRADVPIRELQVIGDAGIKVLSKSNQVMPDAVEACIHDLISQQAAARPNAPAVASWDLELTYSELDSITTKLAHHLKSLGVAPETFVLVCFNKSSVAIVAMIAILKAGGACVPLDPTHPDSSLRYRAEDTRASIAVVSPSLQARLGQFVEKTLALDARTLSDLPSSGSVCLPQLTPSNACFVIYTSGSTGKPKGVVLEHRGIATNAEYSGPSLGYRSDSRVLQFASYTFDNSLAEIFTTLKWGGCVCVPSDEERLNDLVGVINRLQVTFIDVTPTVACFLHPADVPTLKTIALGGEAVTVKCVDMWRDRVSLQCCYGPSECSVNSTYSGDIATPGKATNIGRAVGCVVWVVDPNDHDTLLPLGCAGELLVDGPVVSRGYLNLPEKTKQSFIRPPPWLGNISPHLNEDRRLYKTGDLVRYDADGTLTYLGRKDTQVKLNGQRIELGEIEHHIELSMPEGTQSAVELVVVNNVKSLACFICSESDSHVPASSDEENDILAMSDDFRARAKQLEVVLSAKVPAYMVPTIWLPMCKLPLTSSGKLNRRGLRSQAQAISSASLSTYKLASKSGSPPSSSIEKKLAAKWASILNIPLESIGVEDNFFKLGGDSVSAMRLVSLARKSDISLTVGTIFQKASLQEMAIAASPLLNIEIEAPQPLSLIAGIPSLDLFKTDIASLLGIESDSILDMYPCTAIQEGLMALSNKKPGAYVAQLIYRLPAGTDQSQFTAAWDRVVEAEPVLRTRIVHTEEMGFVQVVTDDIIEWTTVNDLSGLSSSSRCLPSQNGGRLTNYAVVTEGSSGLSFVWTVHHALYDGWCLPIILDKVRACYENFSSTALTPGPSYSSFIRYSASLDVVAAGEYWVNRLSGISAQPFPRPPAPGYEANASSLLLHKTPINPQSGSVITAATKVRAAWALAVSAYTGSNDVLFLETLTGRDAPVHGIEDMVGATLATIPRRLVVEDSSKLSEYLNTVQSESAATFPYQHMGIQNIQRLGTETGLACGSAQTLIAINNGLRAENDSFWDEQSNEQVGTNFYTYPLMLSCHIGDGEVESVVHYDQNVVSEQHMHRIMGHFAHMVSIVSSDQLQSDKVGDLNMLSPLDIFQLKSWNSNVPAAIEAMVHEMVRKQVDLQNADKLAICGWDKSFTYAELDSLSDRLALALVQQGIGVGSIVPFCFDKSAYVAVSMLAIMKAGAAFVPLDPAQPDSRLGCILEDVEATLILCSANHSERCQTFGLDLIAVSQNYLDGIKDEPRALGSVSADTGIPAYVIFTSGTTGRPKGTIVSHVSFCTGATAHGEAMRMNSSSRVLQFASHTFDASIMEILTTLILGGTVCVPHEEERINDLAGALNRLHVNWSLLTPSVAQMIHPSLVPGLKTLVLGGEAMSSAHISTWSAQDVQLMNAYGPSETAVVAAVNPHVDSTCGPSNIGRAVGGLCWVVDSSNHDRLVPIGAIGELVVEGPILAKGYLKNIQKTEELFITNPMWCNLLPASSTATPRRMYKTGDLVKLADDGSILFQGRKDNQVKINGQRLELSEVEHHLGTDTAVQYGLAIIPSSGPCKGRLLAILSLQSLAEIKPKSKDGEMNLVGKHTSALHLAGIRERVASQLASYMVPSRWIVVDRLPLLPSGKLDRRCATTWVEEMNQALFQSVLEVEESSSVLDRDATPLENAVRDAWAKALHTSADRIPFNQSFLHLGGDSISAMQLISILKSRDIGITVAQVMRSKSVVELASHASVAEEIVHDVEQENVAFNLSPIQKLYFECLKTESTHFNQSILLGTNRLITCEELLKAVETLVREHSMLRARFSTDGVNWSQCVSDDVVGSYRLQRHEDVDAESLSAHIEASQEALNIMDGPLLSADIYEMRDDQSQIVVFAIHHLVVDVVSWNIILQDLEGLLSSGSYRLPKSLSFQTWTVLQDKQTLCQRRDTLFDRIEIPAHNFSFWGMQNELNLHGDALTHSFSIDTHHSLLLLGPSQDAFETDAVDILLASILHSFRHTFSRRQVVPAIFNEGHGREPWDDKLDLSRTVGWFTTLSPVCLPDSLKGEVDFVDIVRWVKDFRRSVSGKGRPYFAHMLSHDQQVSNGQMMWPVELTFNFLGQTQQVERDDAVFKTLSGSMMDSVNAQSDIGSTVPRLALIEISAAINGGSISVDFSFNRRMKHQDLIIQWVDTCKSVINHGVETLSQMSPEPTMSNYPLLPLEFRGVPKMQQKLLQIGVASLSEVEDVYPCSPVQQGILFTQIKNPQYYSYKIAFEINCTQATGEIDLERLSKAWQAVVDRHSTLRTIFVDSLLEEGSMNQVVLKSHPADVSCFECTEEDLVSMLQSHSSIGFPEHQPPHRFRFCQTPQGRVGCLLEMSHAISDGTSMPVLFQDLALAYEVASPRPALSVYVNYLDYVAKTDSLLTMSYWRTYLEGAEPCCFPTSSKTATEPRTLRALDQQITNAHDLQMFCTEQGMTLSNILQLAWAMVLQAYTGLDDVCFGYLVSGRDIPVDGINEAIGLFINMLTCRVKFDASSTLEDTVQAFRRNITDSLQHKSASLADVQHEMGTSGNPLFNTAYSFQRRSVSKKMATGALSFDVHDAQDPSEYDITVNVEVWDGVAQLQLCYWSDMISDTQAKNVATTFNKILQSFTTTHLTSCIGQLDIFSDHCFEQVISWNRPQQLLLDQCVHHVFEQNAREQPVATQAIQAWDGNFTYSELDAASNRLAHHLFSNGLQPETFVPLCFEKSAWTVVAMLAVLKAGSAFVPLDPNHPSERIKFLVESVEARMVLCSPSYAHKFQELDIETLPVSNDLVAELPYVSPQSDSVIQVSPRSPAYIIFTSGTTGLPKGTIIDHQAFTTGGTMHAKAIKMTAASRVLQFASYTFDASIMEILSTLLVGGCICIPNDQERLNNLRAVIQEYDINWTLLTPSVAKILKPGSVPNLKVLVTGGEAMSKDHIVKWAKHACLINAYGPSETSVIAATSTKVDEQGIVHDDDPATIGHAVGSRCWVVDPNNHDRLMPLGSVGELLVEGPILARGYLNNKAKTEAVFINHPPWRTEMQLDGERKDRMYKTGDLVAYNDDGTLSYKTRKDTQIKLNGQRIELGEIEHHVKTHLPGDAQSIVDLVTPQSKTSAKALAVFFETEEAMQNEAAAEIDEILVPMSPILSNRSQALQIALRGILPSYMVPTIYVPVSKMPWTTAGKLDRQRLKSIVQRIPASQLAEFKLAGSVQRRKPATPMERRLHQVWQKVLKLDASAIGRDDSFFKLGGDSIGAMKLVAAAGLEDVILTVLIVFKHPKLIDMAEYCQFAVTSSIKAVEKLSLLRDVTSPGLLLEELADQCQVPVSEIEDAYPCSSLQEGLFTLSLRQPGAYVAENVFELPENVDLQRFKLAWQKTVDHADILRSRIVNSQTLKSYQVVLKPHPIVWEDSDSFQATMNSESCIPGRNGGRLTRYKIIHSTGSGGRYLVWTIHHALYDAWSMDSMMKMVVKFYYEKEEISPGSILPFANFVRYLADSDVNESNRFWRTKLQDASPSHFPPVLAAASNEGQSTSSLVSSAEFDRSALDMDITMPSVIRAAWALVLASHTGSDDVVFGETLSGRDIPLQGVSNIVGPTLTTVPTRIQIDQQTIVGEFLRTLHKNSAEVIPYQHAGLQNIKHLGETIAVACDFNNLLVIQSSVDDDPQDQALMTLKDDRADQDGFFTYSLVFECTVNPANLTLNFHHNPAVISTWHIQRIAHQFEAIVRQLISACSSQTARIQDIELCSPEDIQTIKEWNSFEFKHVNESIPTLFHQAAARTPQSTAIHAWDGQLTYRELQSYATSLAHKLIQDGLQPGSLVPCCMDRSLWTSVSLLAVLMTGAGIVPLDPAHPPARHMEIARDCKSSFVLASLEHQHRFTPLNIKCCVVDEALFLSIDSGRVVPVNSLPEVRGEDAAFVIFTSGSTGKPKGVVIEHRTFNTSATAFRDRMNVTQASRVFHFSSYAFDISMGETFAAFTIGACLCVPSEEMRTGDLAGAMNTLGATWAFLTPSVANIQDATQFKTLETLVCGGEALVPETISKWADRVVLMNGYGPAECTVFAVANADVSTDRDHTQIGQAMSGGRTWVVDRRDHNQLVPVGCAGELLMEGPIVARGYLDDPVKTAQSFVDSPTWAAKFKDIPEAGGMRLYKTGDLVKYLPNGKIVFAGRKDQQVKLHGQRMELGEIEAKLESDPGILHALVNLPKSGLCKGRLVAIISLNELQPVEALTGCSTFNPLSRLDLDASREAVNSVQSRLAEKLPSYMVPSVWLVVEAIPLLVSGKLDRKSAQIWLTDMDVSTYQNAVGHDDVDEFVAPETTAESLIRAVWAKILNLTEESVPVNRSFISLGGDSILAMQVMTRCRDHSIHLSLQSIIRSKSIAELAKNVVMADSKAQNSAPEYEEKLSESFALSPIQQLYFNTNPNPIPNGHFNQSQLLALHQPFSESVLKAATQALVERHSMLRARFVKNNIGEWNQLISPDVASSYRFRAHQITIDANMNGIIEESHSAVSVSGPLFMVDIFEKPDGSQVVSLIAHHLVVDVVSWINIIQDLELFLGTSSLTSPRPLSFQEWSMAQASHAKSHESEGSQFMPIIIQPAEPTFWGMNDAPNTYGDTIHKSFVVSDTSVLDLLFGKAHDSIGTEPLDLFISALLQSFGLVFEDRSLPALFNEVHGREPWDDSLDLSGTVGWFTSLFPLQVFAEDVADTVDIVRRVKDLRRSVPGNGRPYFAHRYLTDSGKRNFCGHECMEILLNYLGRTQQKGSGDSLLQPYDYPRTDEESLQISDVGSRTERLALFEISISMGDDGLSFSFIYNKNMLHQDRINEWILCCQATLSKLATELTAALRTPTISDLPLLPVNYAELDDLVSRSLPAAQVQSYSEVEDIYPCSPMQVGILLSQLQDSDRYIFHTIVEVTALSSPVDASKLCYACAQVIDRHPALRTVFVDSVYRGGSFDQVVLKPREPRINIVKCREIEVMVKLNAASLRRANDKHGPKLPYQITICQTPQKKVFMKFELNHAITDGASSSLIMREIAEAYADNLVCANPPSYKKYIEYISKQSTDSSLRFWTGYLSGAQATEFPALNQHAATERILGSINVDFTQFPELHSLSAATGITISNILVSAWALLLRSYTKSDDVCFGYLASGRDAQIDGIDSIVGPFINMLVFRFQFAPGMLLKGLFRDAQEDYLASLPHQHFSLARVTRAIGRGAKSIFNTSVSMQNGGYASTSAPDVLTFDPVEAHDPSEYAVTLNVNTTRGDEGILLRYWSDVLSETQAQELASTMIELLTDFITNSNEALSHLRLFQGPQPLRKRYSESTSISRSSTAGDDEQTNMDTSIGNISSRVSTGRKSLEPKPAKNVASQNQLRDLLAGKLMTLWKETLEIGEDIIFEDTSFFELGGDSIVAMVLAGNAREIDVSLTVADIFKNPTFGDMLQCLLDRQDVSYASSSSDGDTSLFKKDALTVGEDSLEPPSFLNEIVTEQFIRDNICPAIGVSRASILDVLPTTDFQAQAVAGTLLESRWMLNHFYLDGKGPLNTHLLRESIANVIASFDVLRTVFAPYKEQYLQVILRQLQPSFTVRHVDDIEEYTSVLETEHAIEPLYPGDTSLRIVVAQHNASERHRIFLRISHAQYDGVCFPTILGALKACYEGEPIFPPTSYAKYIRGTLGKINSEHYAYWRQLLDGSNMTDIIPREHGILKTVPTQTLKQVMSIPSLAAFNITPATVIKAAWSIVLSKLTGESDVVFGHLISGRNTQTVPGIEHVVGPCLNVVPVRVCLDSKWTALQLLHYIQDQQVDNMPYETLGFQEIIDKCTDWNINGKRHGFSTVVQHQSMPQTGSLSIGGNVYQVGSLSAQEDTADFSVVTTPLDNENVEVCLLYADDDVVPEHVPRQIMEGLRQAIGAFVDNLYTENFLE